MCRRLGDERREKAVRILPGGFRSIRLFQCVQAANGNPIDKILLSTSGGPFFGKKIEEMSGMTARAGACTPERSIRGQKITIDSGDHDEQGSELIEAMWRCDPPPEEYRIVVHREEYRALGGGVCERR